MFLFLRLILAHFVGDTILQPDEVYEIKKNSLWGVVLHALIIFSLLAGASHPYLKYPEMWLLLIFAGAEHLIQDEYKMRHEFPKKNNFFIFITDQLLHLVFLTPALIFMFSNQPAKGYGVLIELYNNTTLVIFSIGLVVSVFLGAYIWEAYKISYFRNPSLFDPNRIKYGMFERCVIVVSVAFSAWWFLMIPVVFRAADKQKRLTWSMIFNMVLGGVTGLLLRDFLPIF